MSDREEISHSHYNNDRVKVSYNRKFNLGNYQTLDIAVGLDSDRETDEDIDEAFDRIKGIVEKQFKALCDKVDPKKGGK